MAIPNHVDLFVVGADFYAGSIKTGRLEDGWCNFRELVQEKAKEYFERELGAIWYLAKQVPPSAHKSFEERARQRMWLDRQGESVARIIIDCDARGPSGVLVPGGEFRCNTEEDAVPALKQTPLPREAMVISADRKEASPLRSFLDEKYDDSKLVVLVPPDLVMRDEDKVQLQHADLEQARLGDDPLIPWERYLESKEKGLSAGIRLDPHFRLLS
jgi:hypothetical protein